MHLGDPTLDVSQFTQQGCRCFHGLVSLGRRSVPGNIRQSCKEKDPLCRKELPYSKPILSRATEAPGAAGMVTCLLSPLSVHYWPWWSSHATGSSRKPIRLSPKIPLSAEQSVFPTCMRMSYRSRTAPCMHLHKSKPVLGSRGAEERPDGTWGSCTHLSTKQTWQ